MKVLIMSHNPVTDYNSMGKTLLGLFFAFSENELCQFYVYPTLPNVKVCKSYYRMTDREALHSIVCRGRAGRRIADSEIKRENTLYEDKSASRMYRDKGSHRELKILARDAIWKMSAWGNPRLAAWLAEERPDVIFAAPGASGFFYRLILRIAEICRIPIVTYVCDDFYFSSQHKRSLIGRFYARYIRRKIETLIRASRHIVTISDELAHDYATAFRCACSVISTGANLTNAPAVCSPGDGKIISYFGNLQLGRYRSLAEVARSVDMYNDAHDDKVTLNIYTADASPKITAAFEGTACVRFCGFLSADKIREEMKKASILLHIESFDKEDRERVKYSVSTKIAESLASGVCLFAYGPEGISSIEYLRRNECALVAVNHEELSDKLSECLEKPEVRAEKASKGLKIALTNHDNRRQSERLKSILSMA